MNLLFDFLESIAPLSADLRDYLTLTTKSKAINKKQFLVKAGRVCEHVYFIEKGLVRCFYIDDDREISSWFIKEGQAIIVDSFCNQLPSHVSIQAIEDCQVYYISFRELQSVFHLFPEFNYIGRELVQKHYGSTWEYVYNTKMKKAHERYGYFITNFPDLANRIPLQFLASFLNITPVWLSKIRAKFRFIKLVSF